MSGRRSCQWTGPSQQQRARSRHPRRAAPQAQCRRRGAKTGPVLHGAHRHALKGAQHLRGCHAARCRAVVVAPPWHSRPRRCGSVLALCTHTKVGLKAEEALCQRGKLFHTLRRWKKTEQSPFPPLRRTENAEELSANSVGVQTERANAASVSLHCAPTPCPRAHANASVTVTLPYNANQSAAHSKSYS